MAAPLNGLGNEPKTLRSVAIHRRLMVWKPIAENPSRNRSFSPIRVTRDAKVSLCVGDARRAALDALGTRYRRTFADQWDFVRFATEGKLGLDFTTPPRRPDAGR
jgi:hypothetical protein